VSDAPAEATRHAMSDPPPPTGGRHAPVLVAAALAVIVAVAVVAVLVLGGDDGDAPAGDVQGQGANPAGGDEPPDVAIVGDSLVEQSRDQFIAHADELGLTVETAAFGGSAPCDWLDAFEGYAASPPDVLIISFAGNDNTPCVNPDGGPPRDPQAIADAYAEDMPGIVDLFRDTDTEVYVVQPPPVGAPASEPAAIAIRAVYRGLAESRPGITLVDPAPLLGPDGRFHRTLPCEPWEEADCGPDGTVALRNEDGIHLTPAGGERYARVLLDAIGQPVPE
jgi:lysophospholipase L1-like esterase